MFEGSMVALVTPFNGNGEVDFTALETLVEWHITEKTEGIVLCGSTGESGSLSYEEKSAIFQLGVEVADGRIPIIASTGESQTAETVELTKEAEKWGVDGCLVICPFYSRPSEEGCYFHFKKIAEVGLPMIVYYNPGRCGGKISPGGLAKICSIDNVVALKDASSDLNSSQELMQLTKKPLLSGDDTLSLAHLGIGFKGVISVACNVIPRRLGKFVKEALQGRWEKAREEFYEMYPLCSSLTLETNPQGIKYAVSLLEKCLPLMRLPLIEPKESTKELIQKALLQLSGALNEFSN